MFWRPLTLATRSGDLSQLPPGIVTNLDQAFRQDHDRQSRLRQSFAAGHAACATGRNTESKCETGFKRAWIQCQAQKIER